VKDRVLTLYVVNGVTTARSMLGDTSHLTMRAQIARGDLLGPRIIAAGPSFNGNSVKTPLDAANMVKAQKAAGYDLLKIHPGVPRDAYDAMATTAKEVGIPFAGHVPFDVGWAHATSTGYATIDHVDGLIEALAVRGAPITANQVGFFGMALVDSLDESRIPSLVKQARDGKVWLVPTAALLDTWVDDTPGAVLAARPEMKYWLPNQVQAWAMNKTNTLAAPENTPARRARFIEVRRKALRDLHKGGVGILLGSDAPQVWNVPGFSVHRELAALVAAGLTPFEALATGTVNVATYLKESAKSGTVAQGKVADLILLDANPLTDITNTTKISGVMVQGRWLPKAEIDRKLAALVN
jgi:imidazolonepropionase-like amidohydrolase